jgi:hypothetical protein
MNSELNELKTYWLEHGEYESSLKACRDARENGFHSITLSEMVELYKEVFE